MRLRKLYISISLLVSILTGGAALVPAHTAAQATATGTCGKTSSSFLGFPTWYKHLEFSGSAGNCNIEFDVTKDFPKIGLALFEIILRIGGLVAVGFIIFGGFQYLISQGEPDRLKGARTTIINALVGLAITVSATVIVNLIAGSIT